MQPIEQPVEMATAQEAAEHTRRRLAAARLPALPQVLLQLIRLCEDDAAGTAEIAAVVGRDATLSARVASVARSPLYRRGRQPDDLDQCIALLGTRTVRSIALNQAVLDLFGRFQGGGRHDLVPFWGHALHCALLARELAPPLGHPRSEEAYLAGLLHDIGRLALLCALPQDYATLFESLTDEQSLIEAERARFGLTHAEAGAWLAQRWGFEPLFCDAIRHHHEAEPSVRDAHSLTQVLHLAERLGQTTGDLPDLTPWGLTPEASADLMQRVHAQRAQIAEQFGIRLPEPGAAGVARQTEDAATASVEAALARQAEAQLLAGCLPWPSAADVDVAGSATQRSARLLFDVRTAALMLVRDGELRGYSPHDPTSRLGELRLRLPADSSAVARSLGGTPAIVTAADGTLALPERHLLHLLDAQALLALPLLHEGEALGVLVLGLDLDTAEALRRRPELVAAFARESGRCLGEARRQGQRLEQAVQEVAERHALRVRQTLHEVSNPLGVINNYLALLRERLAQSAETGAEIDLMRDELRRIGRLLQQLGQSQDTPEPEGVALNDLIRRALELCRRGRPELARVELRLELEETIPPLRTDRDKLTQILVNLIFNAVEAMSEGGRLSLSTSVWHDGTGARQVQIEVADTGPGLPQEVLQQLYRPVASRKGGGHAGLGLSVVGRLAEELGAVLQCHTTRAGTRFKLLLPA